MFDYSLHLITQDVDGCCRKLCWSHQHLFVLYLPQKNEIPARPVHKVVHPQVPCAPILVCLVPELLYGSRGAARDLQKEHEGGLDLCPVVLYRADDSHSRQGTLPSWHAQNIYHHPVEPAAVDRDDFSCQTEKGTVLSSTADLEINEIKPISASSLTSLVSSCCFYNAHWPQLCYVSLTSVKSQPYYFPFI